MGSDQRLSGESQSVVPWEPQRCLKQVEQGLVQYSRGFLRSRPERWFPSFAGHWLPLAHSLGVEVQIIEVKPILIVPSSLEYGFSAYIDNDLVAVLLDQSSAKTIVEAVTPGATPDVEQVVLDYMMRRFIYSSAVSWSAVENSKIEFDATVDPLTRDWSAAVKLVAMINNRTISFWIVLSENLLNRLDGLWRRQIHSQARVEVADKNLRIEIAQLVVSPIMFPEYSRSGAVIDLEVTQSDLATAYVDEKPLIQVRLATDRSHYVIESLPGMATSVEIPEDMSRVSVEIGAVAVDKQLLSEFLQPASFLQTTIPVENRVSLVSQKKIIAEGTLCIFEDRFAVVID